MPKAAVAAKSAFLTGRTAARTVGLLSCVALLSCFGSPPALPAPAPTDEAPRIAFTQRYHAVQHGGLARASNAGITCRKRLPAAAGRAVACAGVRRGGAGVNSDYEMFYSDLDDDPNTYNSTRAELVLPKGARVSYARLYWGGNLRVSEQKPPEDNGRVLIAEPGGRYKEVLADTRIGHRVDASSDAYQASADITALVRRAGAGLWTVSQVNIARGHSDRGAWGGWTMVVAYEDESAPRRRLTVWDGFERLAPEGPAMVEVTSDGQPVPAGGAGTVGVVGYDGDRGSTGDSLSVTADKRGRVPLSDPENPANDVMNSTITEFSQPPFKRQPEHINTLGYDADVFDLSDALTHGAHSLKFRFEAERGGHFIGALFVQADVRR
ncbi:DUF3344 domain-containing protein [Streptomyces sp. NPDC006879]|uniref:DUF3344 domain-containing protein n=1 Tax=Streptomyces sp. NPDC006879 TaxID=3364767 RepID=UPI0036CECBF5